MYSVGKLDDIVDDVTAEHTAALDPIRLQSNRGTVGIGTILPS